MKKILIYFLVFLVIGFVGIPFLWAILSSLKPIEEILTSPPKIFPSHFTSLHYSSLQETKFFLWFKNSLVVSGTTTFVSVVISSLGAYGLTRFRFWGRNLYSQLVLFTYMFPTILIVIPLFVFLSKFGLVNSHIGLILSYLTFSLPFCLWLLVSFFQTIPVELEEAAMVDGANRMKALIKVVLPIAIPGIIATGIFTFILAWSEYLFALVFLSSETKFTLPLGFAGFVTQTEIMIGLVLSGTVLICLPVSLLFVFAQKFLIQGIGAGAVKG